jgi:hypothetical protein
MNPKNKKKLQTLENSTEVCIFTNARPKYKVSFGTYNDKSV